MRPSSPAPRDKSSIVLDRMEQPIQQGREQGQRPGRGASPRLPAGGQQGQADQSDHDLGRRLSDLVREDVYDGGRIGSTVRSTIAVTFSPRIKSSAMPAIKQGHERPAGVKTPRAKDHPARGRIHPGCPAKARFPTASPPLRPPPPGRAGTQ